MSGSVYLLDELRSALATQTPDHDLTSARGAAAVEAPDPEAIATMHTPEPIGGDLTHHTPVLRKIWWQHHGLGYRYPAEPGIIVIDGGKS